MEPEWVWVRFHIPVGLLVQQELRLADVKCVSHRMSAWTQPDSLPNPGNVLCGVLWWLPSACVVSGLTLTLTLTLTLALSITLILIMALIVIVGPDAT